REAEAKSQIRKERKRADFGRPVRHLHRHCGRSQRRSRDAESDGDDLRAVDSGGVGVWASREGCVTWAVSAQNCVFGIRPRLRRQKSWKRWWIPVPPSHGFIVSAWSGWVWLGCGAWV